MAISQQCPCGSEKLLSHCCLPFIHGDKSAPTPEALMRSRYTAYALGGCGEYLLKTWHPATAKDISQASLDDSETEWLGLTVLAASVEGDNGSVSFEARYRADEGFADLKEVSAFCRVGGRWFYIGGEVTNTAATVGRNDLCPCGSGRKYKKCCL